MTLQPARLLYEAWLIESSLPGSTLVGSWVCVDRPLESLTRGDTFYTATWDQPSPPPEPPPSSWMSRVEILRAEGAGTPPLHLEIRNADGSVAMLELRRQAAPWEG